MSFIKLTLQLLITLFVSCLAYASTATNSSPLRIIMVHSYHHGFEWTDAVDEGFENALSKHYQIQTIARYYLDAKRAPEKIQLTATETLKDLQNQKFDLLFITDDDAMKLIGTKYLNSNKYLVFAGINRSLSEYGIQGTTSSDIYRSLPKNAAGVLEYYPMIGDFCR